MTASAPQKPQFTFEPEEIAPSVYRLPLPFQGGWSAVNAFAFLADSEARLLDSGPQSDPASIELLFEYLRSLGVPRSRIRQVLVSHGHPDHAGGTPRMVEAGAEILMHGAERETIAGPDRTWLAQHGLRTFGDWTPRDYARQWRSLQDGEILDWGAAKLEILHCPGHTRGLLMLFDRERGMLFSSDHVMRRDNSQIELYRPPEDDRLGSYLSSIARLRELPIELVQPGHGRGFRGFKERAAEIGAEVDRRLGILLEGLRSGPKQATELALLDGLGFKAPWARNPDTALRAALMQALSHLEHLVATGRARRLTEGEQVYYGPLTDGESPA